MYSGVPYNELLRQEQLGYEVVQPGLMPLYPDPGYGMYPGYAPMVQATVRPRPRYWPVVHRPPFLLAPYFPYMGPVPTPW
ncbi:hypothetical protein [Desertibacillus haloalkaliphilus]|uniref:hypothetical protein n=1 Tax=Desertibacillus haloalkaliphilus TaxID=1328930 RepID=UPI001C25D017|nr:hypothetical protein [Desertibacillus haloalkaliphilus]MBU8907500.1 hypothetical protein [Desertibacillus haloalkaliphilus]